MTKDKCHSNYNHGNSFDGMESPIGARFESRFDSRFETRTPENRKGIAVDGAGETELGEVKSVATSTSLQINEMPCRNGGCKTWRSRVETRTESPWHILKTIFLVSVIVALILWVIVYTLLVQYQIL